MNVYDQTKKKQTLDNLLRIRSSLLNAIDSMEIDIYANRQKPSLAHP